jgi:hypothetical protein
VEAVGEVQHRQGDFQHSDETTTEVPDTQSALLLRAIRQPYELEEGYPTPKVLGDDELLVKVTAVGLNPIDWKAPYVDSSELPCENCGLSCLCTVLLHMLEHNLL